MTYSNHFVMCVLVNGKPLKERADGVVVIPFGAEYTLRFKNKNSRRALVKFSIDNEDASGGGYVIPAHKDIDIRRFSDRDQTFKFVDLHSDEAQLDGKNGPNWDGSKGVIEAKFFLEKQHEPFYKQVPIPVPVPVPYPQPYPYPVYPWPKRQYPYHYNTPMWHDDTYGATWSSTVGAKGMCDGGTQSCNVSMSSQVGSAETLSNFAPQNANPFLEGVTVGGGVSGQQFVNVYFDAETDYVTLKLVLRGGTQVEEAVQAVEIEYCSNCGTKRSRKTDKFCGKCGTKL